MRAADFQEPTAKPDGVINIHFTAPSEVVEYAKAKGYPSPAALAKIVLLQYIAHYPLKSGRQGASKEKGDKNIEDGL